MMLSHQKHYCFTIYNMPFQCPFVKKIGKIIKRESRIHSSETSVENKRFFNNIFEIISLSAQSKKIIKSNNEQCLGYRKKASLRMSGGLPFSILSTITFCTQSLKCVIKKFFQECSFPIKKGVPAGTPPVTGRASFCNLLYYMDWNISCEYTWISFGFTMLYFSRTAVKYSPIDSCGMIRSD